MLNALLSINWLAVLAASALNFLLGGVWFMLLFKRQYAEATFLNPHVYIDTVMLMGAVGVSLPPLERPLFMTSAALASLVWLSSLGFGARFLAPLFARPMAWRVLDVVIGVMMLALAASLVHGAVAACLGESMSLAPTI